MTQAWLLEKYGPRLSVDDLAEVLKMARQTVNNHMSQGTFPVPSYRENGKRWADYRDVSDYIDYCRGLAKTG